MAADTTKPLAHDKLVVSATALGALAAEVLIRSGLNASAAKVVADSLLAADLRGIHSHGVSRLPIYVRRLADGGNVADVEPLVVAETPATALIDAGHALSQVASAVAVEIATAKAAKVGCATVCVRGGSHFGAAGYWAQLMADDGFVGVASTNTSPLMVAWGGQSTAIGTNPIAMAFPSANARPVVIDFATSETTWGALINASGAGDAIPSTWALGRDGNATQDPGEAIAARCLLPFGRHKGYALAVGIELLAGALAGANCLAAIGDMYGETERPMAAGHVFIAIDPQPLSDGADTFPRRVAMVQQELNSLPPRSGVDRVMWPGQLEAELEATRRREGIPLPLTIAREVSIVAHSLGVEVPFEAHADGSARPPEGRQS